MQRSLSCPQGHTWRIEPSVDGATHACPSCGFAALALPDHTAVLNSGPDRAAPPTPADPQNAATIAPSDAAPIMSGERGGSSLPAVPGYELLAELGRGGMGVVYQARHSKLNRLVALKMILAGSHAGAADLKRFQTEAEAIARFQHANIVQVYEVGEHEGKPFFSLEYCSGGSLAQKLNGTPLPPRDAAALVETLARAMQAAHDQHIIHRDLKPANILFASLPFGADGAGVNGIGIAKITDFGLAKKLDEASQTHSGTVIGTPSYMAPEQAGSRSGPIGPAADVYALGAILYECLTGRPPFKAATAVDTIMQVVHDEPVPPSRLQSRTPRDLGTICLKCLQKEPHKRYASAQALADDLGRFREDRPIVARPVSRVERGWRWCRRNPVVATLAALGVAGAIVAVLLLNDERTQTLKNLDRAEEAEKELTSQLAITAQAEHERSAQLSKSYRDQAEARRFSRQVGQRFESLKALAEAARIARELKLDEDVLLDLRRKAIACLALPDLRLDRELPGSFGEPVVPNNIAIDDAFERYALRDKSGAISVRRVADGREIVRLPGTHPGPELWLLAFSPNGRYLAAACNPGHTLKIWDLDRNEPVVTAPAVGEGLDFSPDSGHVAFADNMGELRVYALATGRLERRWQRLFAGWTGVAFHPDGRQIAVGYRYLGKIQIWAVNSGQMLTELNLSGAINQFRWNADGRLLAATLTGDPRIRLWDVPARKQVGVLQGHRNFGIRAAFHPANDLLVSDGWEGRLRLWDPKAGKERLSLPGFGWQKFNRAGDRILLFGKTPQIWEVADGREYRTLVSTTLPGKQPAYPYDFSISPDRRLVAVGMRDGTRIWDLTGGRELAFLPTGGAPTALFQPSGDLLTCGNEGVGLHRWPVRSAPGPDGMVRIGPPHALLAGRIGRLAQSEDGKTVAALVEGQGAVILNPNQPGSAKPLLPHLRAVFVSVSPDGQWVATGSHNGNDVKVWSVPHNKLERSLPIQGGALPVFSPDGRWLYTNCAAERRLWKVGTWGPGPRLPQRTTRFTEDERAAFTPDGRWLALTENSAATTIVETDTGRPVATLDDPYQDHPYGVAFSPDGAQLVFTTWDSYAVHVWDLRRIRAQLKSLDLDWDAPAYPPPVPAAALAPLHVVGAELLDPQKMAEHQRGLTVLDLTANPFDGEAHLRNATFLLSVGRRPVPGHAHLRVALALRPDLYVKRPLQTEAALRLSGTSYVSDQRWREAAVDYVKLAELQPRDAFLSMQAVALLLETGDRAAYRRLGKQILERFGDTINPYEAEQAAKSCLLGAPVEQDLRRLAALTESAVARGQDAAFLGHFQMCRGMSEYRLGRYASAWEWFARGRATSVARQKSIVSSNALCGLFEAMALHRLGRTGEAGRTLATAAAVIDQRFGAANRNLGSDWHDWLFCRIVRREAEQVLKGPAKVGGD